MKKLLALLMALTMSVGMTSAFASCGGDKDNSSSSTQSG